MAQAERISVGGRNDCARGGLLAAFRSSEIEPPSPEAQGAFDVVQAHVDVALGIGAVLGENVGARTSQVRHGQFAESNIQVLDARAVTAHVQNIEVVDFNVLAAVISFTRPELGVRLALQDVTGLDERFTETEVVLTGASGKSRISRRVGSVGLQHHLGLNPPLVGIVVRIQPVIDEDEFSVSFRFVSQTVFRARSGSLKCDLLAANAVQTEARTKISVEFKGARALLQIRDLYVSFLQEVIGGL